MRVIFAGGGTGGHLFPGLAVAREFQRRDEGVEILFVGTEQGIEFRVLPNEGFKLETLSVKGIKGRGLRGVLDAFYGVPASVLRSFKIIGEFRPDCIIGLGGYASGPLLLAGKLKGIRAAIMEQNLQPGFTNKMLARLVDRVFTAYADSEKYFSGARVMETGNPVRWRELPKVPRGEKFSLFIFGGSGGARRINYAVVDALKLLGDLEPEIVITHQTGPLDFAAIKQAYAALPFEAEVTPFIDHMDEAYARADLDHLPRRRDHGGGAYGLRQSGDSRPLSLRDLRSSTRQCRGAASARRRRDDFGSGIDRRATGRTDSELFRGSAAH